MKYKDFGNSIDMPEIDKELAKKITKYKVAMITKNKENMDFMASPYIGIHKIRFTDEDKFNFFFTCGVDKDDIIESISKIDDLNKTWNVANDPFNFFCVSLIEKCYNSNLPNKYKEEMIISIGIIYQFKLLTSIYTHYFDYSEDISVVKAAYESLHKYNLHKKLGSNYAVLEHRARLLIENKTHNKKLKRASIDDIVYIINDMSGALRSTIKKWYTYLLKVKEDNDKVDTISIVTRGEDGERMSDVNDKHKQYTNNIMTALVNKDDWVDRDRIDLILEFATKLKRDDVIASLNYIRNQYLTGNSNDIVELVELIVDVNIKYLYLNKRLYPPYVESIALIVKYLNGLWSSSSAKDKRMRDAKDKLIEMVKKSSNKKNKQYLTYSAIVVSIYIFLLAIKENKN